MNRILLVCNDVHVTIRFRLDFLIFLLEKGQVVRLTIPAGQLPRVALLELLADLIEYPQFSFNEVEFSRASLSIYSFVRSIFSIRSAIVEFEPCIVIPVSLKLSILTALASKQRSTPIVPLITGLGYGFGDLFIKQRVFRLLLICLSWVSFRHLTGCIFQNDDDRRLFTKLILRRNMPTAVVAGSGINLDFFPNVAPRSSQGKFVFVGRLLRDKGLLEFCEAAEIAKKLTPSLEFLALGDVDENPNSFSREEILTMRRKFPVKFIGHVDNVQDYLLASSVLVLPSYREGLPRSIIEGMACAMPIITSDAPGCRETVVAGSNGFLVQVKSVDEIVDKMMFFATNPDSITDFGIASRKLVEQRFDVTIVNRHMWEFVNAVSSS